MRNYSIFTFVFAILIGSVSFTACQSQNTREDKAVENVQDAKQDLEDLKEDTNAQKQLQNEVSVEEWKIFKAESELMIRDNEIRISDLKVKMRKPGKLLDPLYDKKIEKLEQKNADLKERIEAYEKSQSNWEAFKREFKHDMDELGKAMNDLTIDNKK
jgi:hypothetical protein